MIQGGGHAAYAGNEIYVLDLNSLVMSRLYDPSINPPTTCDNNGLMPDGKPQGYHTTNQLAYIPTTDTMLLNEGSNVPCGGTGGKTFLFAPTTNQWSNLGRPGVAISNGGFLGAVEQTLDKLRVPWEASAARKAYNEGRSTQVPVNPTLRVKKRFSRKLSFGNTELRIQR